MNPFDPTSAADHDLDLPIDATVRRTHADPTPSTAPDTYLVRFVADVRPERAEAVLGALEPPDEGIVLAGNGAVIVRADDAFVEHARAHDSVALVNAVRVPRREPTRVQIPEPHS